MENEPDAVSSFLKEANSGESEPIIELEESSELFGKEEPKVEDKSVEDKRVPFAKDPKIQRYIQKELDKRIKDIKLPEAKETVRESIQEADSVLDAFTMIIGNDTAEKKMALEKLAKGLSERDERTYKRAVTEIQSIQQRQTEDDKKAEAELVQGLESIEEEFEVDITSNTPQAKKTRGEFVDFIARIAPKNGDGDITSYPDMAQAFVLFRDISKKASPNRAKELASRGIERSGEASSAPASTEKSWASVDKMLAKMK